MTRAIQVALATDHYPDDTVFTTCVRVLAEETFRTLLLDRLCPADLEERNAVLAGLDVKNNPDLPECFQVLAAVADQWRSGLVEVEMFDGADPDVAVASDAPVESLLKINREVIPSLWLRVATEHRPVDWAVQQGYAADAATVWDWLRAMTALYLVDRHAADIPAPDEFAAADPMSKIVHGLCRRGALQWSDDGAVALGAPGREVIAANLSETERLIEDYDRYCDVRWNRALQEAEFGTGRGADLRVAVMMEYGVDPLRAVFLLRLYDGTLDELANDWRIALSDRALLDVLEPVVNRNMPEPPLEILSAIIADGEDLPHR